LNLKRYGYIKADKKLGQWNYVVSPAM
ncbi:hypothetical protein MNBD_GAMMA16-215, partial [hydrothermal vent metagenome]